MTTVLNSTRDKRHDTFNIFFLIIICIPLGFFTSSSTDIEDILWYYSLWLEAFAALPQLFLFRRTQRLDVIKNDYIFFLGMYKLLYICNWIRKAIVKNKTDYIVWTTGIIQTLLYADFIYYYIMAFTNGSKFKLPL